MHTLNQSHWQHSHNFAGDLATAEKNTRRVILLAAAMMVIEIVAGLIFHSMALLADGWHMGTHVAAFLIAVLAYYFSRRYSADPHYSFGTGKIGVLGGFASAVVLTVIAVLMAGESVRRLFVPLPIHFNEAIGVACVALAVNLVCAILLKGEPHHEHGEAQDHHQSDLNLRAAYIHVLADSFTTFTAICALVAGKFIGWFWLDPVVGIAGSAVVFSWAWNLLRDTSGILVDRTPESTDLKEEIRRVIESDGDSLITDLHVWQIGAGVFAAIVSVVAHEPKSADAYREGLRGHAELVHVTIETHLCQGEAGNRQLVPVVKGE
ncbi:MAG: CDF family Co(II)/Ni(II) efflux transporter DmeF [Verrucomicrobiota bacterium]|jgi:cation diffusion facilitator family transporter